MTRKINAVGYGRFSAAGRRNACSTKDQGNNIRNYAASRGMDLIAYHFDDGITGVSLERSGLQAMIRGVEQCRAEVVIVEDIDRLGRAEQHLRYLEKLFARNGAVLHTLSSGGAIGNLALSLKGIVGEHHRSRE